MELGVHPKMPKAVRKYACVERYGHSDAKGGSEMEILSHVIAFQGTPRRTTHCGTVRFSFHMWTINQFLFVGDMRAKLK
jgi:hypothetical protein